MSASFTHVHPRSSSTFSSFSFSILFSHKQLLALGIISHIDLTSPQPALYPDIPSGIDWDREERRARRQTNCAVPYCYSPPYSSSLG